MPYTDNTICKLRLDIVSYEGMVTHREFFSRNECEVPVIE